MLLLNLLTRAAPYGYPETEETQRLAALWEKHVGPVPIDDYGDFEDFFEQAVRLDAAVKNVSLPGIWLTVNGGKEAKNLESGETQPADNFKNSPHYGLVSTQDFLFNDAPHVLRDAQVDKYWQWDAFQRFAGRDVIPTGFGSSIQGRDIMNEIFSLYQQGVDRFFIKGTQSKSGIWVIELSENLTYEEVYKIVDEELEWSLVRNEDKENCFLVQPYLFMRNEYRFFVVNNTLVTGAGCIEEFTPLDNQAQFDNRMREHRNWKNESVTSQSALLDTYIKFAENVVQQLASEKPEIGSYVLDVAVGMDKKPVIVEFNSLLNSGLYASQPTRVVAALVE
jgi:hypothetical protein